MTLDTHCYDDPGYTLLVLIYIIVAYVPCIHIIMKTLDTHCYDDPGCTLLVYLSISFYLMYPVYTL